MENFDREDFRFIIIESPTNIIEDINCVFDNFIEFQQIKKKDGRQWTSSSILSVIDHMFEIFSEEREKIYTKLNIDPIKELEFKFSFITDQSYNSDIKDFLSFLEKYKNNERIAEDEFQKLNYFYRGKNREEFFVFLKYLKLTFKSYPSRNIDSTTDGVEEECLNRIEKRFRVRKIVSQKVLNEILRIISKKSEGMTVKSRTLFKHNLKRIVMFYKTNEYKNLREELPKDFETVISCIEEHIDKIDQIIINSEYLNNDNKFEIPLKININNIWYFFYLIDRKISRELQSDINYLNDLINEESNILILLHRGINLNLNSLEVVHCFISYDMEEGFRKYFEKLIIDNL